MPARYAVYYAPSAGDALHQAVTPLLGRDALGGLQRADGVGIVFPVDLRYHLGDDLGIHHLGAQGAFRTPPFGNGQPAVALHG
mgnify:CR=1 FL=1